MNQRPTLLTLTTLLATITFVSSLWAFLHCKTQPVMDFITMFLVQLLRVILKNHHSSPQNSPIWWYLGSMSTWKNLKCTQSDVFQLETAACLFHSSSSIIHSVSPPSVEEHSSSFSFGSLRPAESSPNLGTSLCMGMCVYLCVYVHAMFWGKR